MPGIEIRKILTVTEEIHREGARLLEVPTRKAAAVAVIANPCAGRYVENLDFLLSEYGGALGTLLTEHALRELGGGPEKVHNFGKGGIVGLDGEIEHASAILHGSTDPSFGYSLRQVIKAGKSVIRSIEKRGAAGIAIDIPLSYKDAERVRSHFDSMEIRVPDAPRADEIVLVVVLTNAGRPLARIGGLAVDKVKGIDGSGLAAMATEKAVRDINDKILGCLAGTAVGSSMGAATENLTPEQIKQRFEKIEDLVPFVREAKIFRRPAGPTYQYHRDERQPGMTEDGVERQFLITLAIVEKGGRITADDLARIWLREIEPEKHFGYLIEPTDAMFYRLLAGGLPPAAAGQYSWWPGLGGFARSCYPIGIINACRPDDAARDAIEVGRMFQPPHTFGLHWGAVVASAVAEALRPSATVESIIDAATAHVAPEVRQSVLDDVELGRNATGWKDLQRRLQEKYHRVDHRYAHVTAGSAFAAVVMTGGNAKEAIVAAANSAIDTDDVAAIAGAIAGALEGTKNIPPSWIDTVDRGTQAHPRTLVRWTLQEQASRLRDALRRSLDKAQEQIREVGDD